MKSFRGGMQVHAVPESERALDSSGRKLPWGYEYADLYSASMIDRAFSVPKSVHSPRPSFLCPSTPASVPDQDPSFLRDESTHANRNSSTRNERNQETGPFGKSTRRRGLSRARTATPAEKQDQRDRDDNLRAMDAAMNNLKERAKQASIRSQSGMSGALSQSSPEGQAAPDAQPATQPSQAGEPTEVVVYGVPANMQYAALSFYERASGGIFYEDYDRDAPTQRFNSFNRPGHFGRSLSDEALRKKNQYAGGENWIKVTFDSREAADRACHASPHVIKGFLAHAEPYRGAFQRQDQAIPATDENIQSAHASPSPESSRTLALPSTDSPTPSGTASSATAIVAQSAAPEKIAQPQPPASTTALPSPVKLQPLRVRGAKRAVLIPAEQALLPAPSKLQRTLAAIPVVGWLLSGGSELIGGSIPRKDDGTFDNDKASIWWRFWYSIDTMTGWDTCGLKGGYDD